MNMNPTSRNLKECSMEKNRSLTVNFSMKWSSDIDRNWTEYLNEYMLYMNSYDGRLYVASQLREMDICAISAKTLKTIPKPSHNVSLIREEFNQTYSGPQILFNSLQLADYEAYFSSLTSKYTDEFVVANCTVSRQEMIIIQDESLKLRERKLSTGYPIGWFPDYEIIWDPDPDTYPTKPPTLSPVYYPTPNCRRFLIKTLVKSF